MNELAHKTELGKQCMPPCYLIQEPFPFHLCQPLQNYLQIGTATVYYNFPLEDVNRIKHA